MGFCKTRMSEIIKRAHHVMEGTFSRRTPSMRRLAEEDVPDLIHEVNTLEHRAKLLTDALDKIACWNEGEEVTGSFDEPCSAKTAREALKEYRMPLPPVKGGS